MSESLIDKLVSSVLGGGAGGMIALLMLIIGLMIWDRIRLLNDLKHVTDSHKKELAELIDKYYSSRQDVKEAINEIKIVMAKIESKL